ncbi:MAG: hypothetical protein H6707_18030 [Deltaproteobacteria bacterium]|nr:hypothetical protein [Deltaproteobacteria bacterium]
MLLSISVLAFAGCWSTTMVNGKKVSESHWNSSRDDVGGKASFALQCPREKLTFTLLDVHTGNIPPLAQSIGVNGCGKRVVYVRAYGAGWVANTTSR